jgi:hypothetical protein
MTGKIVWTDANAERLYAVLSDQRDRLYAEAQAEAERMSDPRAVESRKRRLLEECGPIVREMARLLGRHTVPGPMLISSLQAAALGIKIKPAEGKAG